MDDHSTVVNCGWCGVASGYGCAVRAVVVVYVRRGWLPGGVAQQQGTGVLVRLYEGSDVRSDDERFALFAALPARDRGLENASSLKYHRRNSVIIIASLLEYKRVLLYILPTLTWSHQPLGPDQWPVINVLMFPILFRSFYKKFWFIMAGAQFYLVFRYFFRFDLTEFSFGLPRHLVSYFGSLDLIIFVLILTSFQLFWFWLISVLTNRTGSCIYGIFFFLRFFTEESGGRERTHHNTLGSYLISLLAYTYTYVTYERTSHVKLFYLKNCAYWFKPRKP